MTTETRSGTRSLNRRQRARQRAKQAEQENRERLERIEQALTNLLMSVEDSENALISGGKHVQELLELGESRKSLASKTGLVASEITRMLRLAEEDAAEQTDVEEDESGDADEDTSPRSENHSYGDHQ